MAESFLLGINYWPLQKAMYWWKQFERDEVEREFAQIRSFGLDIVRLCLLWEDFQPTPETVSQNALRNLHTVLEVAHLQGLKVVPTLITGNMSGIIWWPEWALTDQAQNNRNLQISAGHYTDRLARNIFADPTMLRAQVMLVEQVVQAIGSHAALHSWDLANEADVCDPPPTYDAGWLWCRLLCDTIKKFDPVHPVTYGAHPPSLSGFNGLAINDIAQCVDYLSMHGYPIYSDLAREPLDPAFVPYVTLLTESLGGKPTLMQEFGLCTAAPGQPSHYIQDLFLGEEKQQFMTNEDEEGQYYHTVLVRLWQMGAIGAFAWCYADYAPALWSLPPLDKALRERTFGIVRPDSTLKPAALVLQTFARDLADGSIAQQYGPWGAHKQLFSIPNREYYSDPAHYWEELFKHYTTQSK